MLTIIPAPTADQQSPQQRCAIGDVQALILIEDHGEAGDVLPEKIAKAGLMQMEARLACAAGRYADGMALYDEITKALRPMTSTNPLSGLTPIDDRRIDPSFGGSR